MPSDYRTYRFHGRGFAFQCSFRSNFLRRVFVEFRFIPFKRVHIPSSNKCLFGSLLDAVAQAFRGGLVFHHMGLSAHRIADVWSFVGVRWSSLLFVLAAQFLGAFYKPA